MIMRFHRIESTKARLQLLQPIAGTEQCPQVLEHVEAGYASVLAWRDLAVAERGQLYGFDAAVIVDLYQDELARTSHANKKAKIDQACRKLHGLDVDSVSV